MKLNYKSKLNIIFSLLGFLTSGIILTNYLIYYRNTPLLWEKLNIFFVTWTPTLYLMWCSIVTKKKLLLKEIYLVCISIFFSSMLLTNLLIKDIILKDKIFVEITGPFFVVFLLYYTICFIYGLYNLGISYKKTTSEVEKRIYLLIFVGTLIPISASVFSNIFLRLTDIYPEIIGNIYGFPTTSSIMITFFLYSIVKYGFFKPDLSIKEKLNTLQIKILYLVDIIIITISCFLAIFFITMGFPIDYTIVGTIIITIIVILIIDTSINYILSKYIKLKIVEPIEKISNHAEEVGKGNFSNKVGFDGEDEIAILSRQMDEMTEKLKKTSEIRDNFNKALQMEVQIKTAKLQETYDQLKEADKAKKDFIDAIAHELYNPLAIISLSDEFINWDTIGPDNKKMITSIHRNVKRLNELVKEIEEFNLIGRHENKLNIEQVDLKELIALISQDFIILANNKKIDFSVSSSGKNFTIEGDIKQLTKVFVNLMENAVNFSNEGGEIKVKIEEKEENIEVKIKDKGIGIREKDIDRVFEKFYRAKVDNELMQGIGLGLPISLDIVTKHGGFINVKSKYGEGSTFKVILPKKHVIL
ncbi:MAG: HAMP domain-containing protein [Candidatus Methanofastidiosa archaeon]|nr:HAMP domain-containing protein [Candidatus Methanofastidiosa archaeon]